MAQTHLQAYPTNSPRCVQCTPCTVRRTMYGVRCTVYVIPYTRRMMGWGTMNILRRTVYDVQCTPCIARTVYAIQCTYSVNSIVYVQCTPYSVTRTVYVVQCTAYTVIILYHLVMLDIQCTCTTFIEYVYGLRVVQFRIRNLLSTKREDFLVYHPYNVRINTIIYMCVCVYACICIYI